MGLPVYEAVHDLVVGAPAGAVFDVLADAARWPAIFGPTLDVRDLRRQGDEERFQLWATVNGEVRSWWSRRVPDPVALTIGFEQEHTSPPFASMAGSWRLTRLPGNRTEIVLRHRFSVVDDDQAALGRINEALDRNSGQELAAVGRIAEFGHPIADLVFSFEDTLEVPGTAAAGYDFLYRADLWPERLPHVDRVVLRETAPGVQDLEMDTVTADGSRHTTRSIRVCSPPGRIAYKQLVTPELLLGHSGVWTLTQRESRLVMTARHLVAIDPPAVERVLGTGTTLAEARASVRRSLGGNSLATLGRAAEFAREPTALPRDPTAFPPEPAAFLPEPAAGTPVGQRPGGPTLGRPTAGPGTAAP